LFTAKKTTEWRICSLQRRPLNDVPAEPRVIITQTGSGSFGGTASHAGQILPDNPKETLNADSISLYAFAARAHCAAAWRGPAGQSIAAEKGEELELLQNPDEDIR
jgi:hypothetical protein